MSNERGIALVLTLLLIITLTVVGIAAMRTSVIETRISSYYREQKNAFYTAEAGINLVRTDYAWLDSIYRSAPTPGESTCAKGSLPSCPDSPLTIDDGALGFGARTADIYYTYYGEWLPKRGSGWSAKAKAGGKKVKIRQFKIESEGKVTPAGGAVGDPAVAKRKLRVIVEQTVPTY